MPSPPPSASDPRAKTHPAHGSPPFRQGRLPLLGAFFFSSRRRHTRCLSDWSSDVCSSDLKRTGSLNFGAGYSTVDKLIGFVELTQGNFDITNWPGLTGAGQKFRAKAQIGSQRKDFVVAVTEPYFLEQRLSLGGQVFYSEASYLSSVYEQRNYGFSLEARKPLLSWVYTVLGYTLQNYDIYNVATDVSPGILAEEGTTTKSQVSDAFIWDRRDNPFLTRKGERVSLSGYVAGGPLGGDEQIYGFDLQAT